MENMLSALSTLSEQAKALQEAVSDPRVLRFMELAAKLGHTPNVMPADTDILILPSEARAILRVSGTAISSYERNGLLTAYYTPGSDMKKYWRSEVVAIAQREPGKGGKGNGNHDKPQ